MADHGHDLRFGYFLLPDHGDPAGTLRLARLVEELGFDLIGIQDHPYQAGHYETFALIATILARTERIRVFPDVANLPLRPPVMLAKTAATLDELSGGRFELGLGAGAFPTAVTAWGGPQLTPGAAVSALEEAIAVIPRSGPADPAGAASASTASTTASGASGRARAPLTRSESGWGRSGHGCCG